MANHRLEEEAIEGRFPRRLQEIGFFDRGPISLAPAVLGGLWSAYYNGAIYGSEIARGFDSYALRPTAHLSQNEIDAKTLDQVDKFVDRAEEFLADGQTAAARAQLRALANQLEEPQHAELRDALRDLADAI